MFRLITYEFYSTIINILSDIEYLNINLGVSLYFYFYFLMGYFPSLNVQKVQ